MSKNFLSRLLALVLVMLMALSFLAACGNDEYDERDEDSSGLEHNDENPNIKGVDYEGYEFTFLCQPYLAGDSYSVDYMVSDNETSSVLSDAVYRRNKLLEEKYNIKFAQMKVTDLITTVRTQIMGGVPEFDMIVDGCGRLAILARDNYLYNLKSIDRFDMTKSYWDSNAAEQLLVGDKLYFTNCDLNVQEVAFVVYFNKKLIEDYELTSPYEYMENNEWTLDNWKKLVTSIYTDVDGMGRNETDIYGSLYEHHNTRMFLYGAGVRATTNNEYGIPEVTLFKDKDKTVSVYEKCKEAFTSSGTWSIDEMRDDDTHGFGDKWDYARSLFCSDMYLFHYEGTNIIQQFADMESEFGIVPFPKADSTQEKYYSMYPFNCTVVAIPNVVENLERTANIVEDLNYYSSIILKPAWYETLLSRRYARDDESEASLDIILEGRVYDVGMYYDFGGIRKDVLDLDIRRSANIVRSYDRKKNAIEADIKTTYKQFGLLNK